MANRYRLGLALILMAVVVPCQFAMFSRTTSKVKWLDKAIITGQPVAVIGDGKVVQLHAYPSERTAKAGFRCTQSLTIELKFKQIFEVIDTVTIKCADFSSVHSAMSMGYIDFGDAVYVQAVRGEPVRALLMLTNYRCCLRTYTDEKWQMLSSRQDKHMTKLGCDAAKKNMKPAAVRDVAPIVTIKLPPPEKSKVTFSDPLHDNVVEDKHSEEVPGPKEWPNVEDGLMKLVSLDGVVDPSYSPKHGENHVTKYTAGQLSMTFQNFYKDPHQAQEGLGSCVRLVVIAFGLLELDRLTVSCDRIQGLTMTENFLKYRRAFLLHLNNEGSYLIFNLDQENCVLRKYQISHEHNVFYHQDEIHKELCSSVMKGSVKGVLFDTNYDDTSSGDLPGVTVEQLNLQEKSLAHIPAQESVVTEVLTTYPEAQEHEPTVTTEVAATYPETPAHQPTVTTEVVATYPEAPVHQPSPAETAAGSGDHVQPLNTEHLHDTQEASGWPYEDDGLMKLRSLDGMIDARYSHSPDERYALRFNKGQFSLLIQNFYRIVDNTNEDESEACVRLLVLVYDNAELDRLTVNCGSVQGISMTDNFLKYRRAFMVYLSNEQTMAMFNLENGMCLKRTYYMDAVGPQEFQIIRDDQTAFDDLCLTLMAGDVKGHLLDNPYDDTHVGPLAGVMIDYIPKIDAENNVIGLIEVAQDMEASEVQPSAGQERSELVEAEKQSEDAVTQYLPTPPSHPQTLQIVEPDKAGKNNPAETEKKPSNPSTTVTQDDRSPKETSQSDKPEKSRKKVTNTKEPPKKEEGLLADLGKWLNI